jgi:hypothetical protein
MQHVINGASDDTVQVDGPKGGEFYAYDQAVFLEFRPSDDVFLVMYVRGVWRVVHYVIGPREEIDPYRLKVSIDAMPPDQEGEDATGRYTDRVTVDGPVSWIEGWESWPPKGDEIRSRIVEAASNGNLSDRTARDMWDAFKFRNCE